ncbi:MAG: TRAP transporter permease, partial [Candidatus Marinimicrobia bacterium]|nr:TRAP transporter permease [Candidatus Neomarinimicrobiota bacterium]
MVQNLNRIETYVFKTLSVGLVLFYILSATLMPAATEFHRGIYVFITYVLVFMLYKSPQPSLRPLDYFLMLLSIISISY